MATGLQGLTLYSQLAGVDLTNKLFCFAAVDANGNLILGTNNGVVIGVLIEVNGINQPASAQLDGIGKIILSGTIAANTLVGSDGNGHAVGGATYLAGITLQGGNVNEIVPIKLF
jgi:hypothetical protein